MTRSPHGIAKFSYYMEPIVPPGGHVAVQPVESADDLLPEVSFHRVPL